ncbi:hypothetical protein [Burkholderia lata]|uniref:hypothetical protein n=1 Tax=Burkholderia lata (strain ATCC 17760 / DSM 23089 / LMG 22485 / NCIMB 9086 / R18194 / 383) TaxID=482957 RepID=UPI0015815D06|nr:hypothetical protein [Burkholderia lata]
MTTAGSTPAASGRCPIAAPFIPDDGINAAPSASLSLLAITMPMNRTSGGLHAAVTHQCNEAETDPCGQAPLPRRRPGC